MSIVSSQGIINRQKLVDLAKVNRRKSERVAKEKSLISQTFNKFDTYWERYDVSNAALFEPLHDIGTMQGSIETSSQKEVDEGFVFQGYNYPHICLTNSPQDMDYSEWVRHDGNRPQNGYEVPSIKTGIEPFLTEEDEETYLLRKCDDSWWESVDAKRKSDQSVHEYNMLFTRYTIVTKDVSEFRKFVIEYQRRMIKGHKVPGGVSHIFHSSLFDERWSLPMLEILKVRVRKHIVSIINGKFNSLVKRNKDGHITKDKRTTPKKLKAGRAKSPKSKLTIAGSDGSFSIDKDVVMFSEEVVSSVIVELMSVGHNMSHFEYLTWRKAKKKVQKDKRQRKQKNKILKGEQKERVKAELRRRSPEGYVSDQDFFYLVKMVASREYTRLNRLYRRMESVEEDNNVEGFLVTKEDRTLRDSEGRSIAKDTQSYEIISNIVDQDRIDNLDPQHKHILLDWLGGFTFRETCERLDINRSQVYRMRLNCLVSFLEFTDEEFEEGIEHFRRNQDTSQVAFVLIALRDGTNIQAFAKSERIKEGKAREMYFDALRRLYFRRETRIV